MERQRADVVACIKANRGIRRHGTIFLNPWIVNHARETDTIRNPVDRRFVLFYFFFLFSFSFFYFFRFSSFFSPPPFLTERKRERERWTNQRKLKVSPRLYLLCIRASSFSFSFVLFPSFFLSLSFSYLFLFSLSYARKCSLFLFLFASSFSFFFFFSLNSFSIFCLVCLKLVDIRWTCSLLTYPPLLFSPFLVCSFSISDWLSLESILYLVLLRSSFFPSSVVGTIIPLRVAKLTPLIGLDYIDLSYMYHIIIRNLSTKPSCRGAGPARSLASNTPGSRDLCLF